MKFLEKVWSALGLYEYVEVDEEDNAAEDAYEKKAEVKAKQPMYSQSSAPEEPSWLKKSAVNSTNNNNIVSLPVVNKQVKVMVVEPSVFDDAQSIADHIRAAKPVVVNFENTSPEVMKRIIDFISGTVYALNGNIQLVGNNIMICAPNNVDIDASKEFLSSKDFGPWRQ